MISADIINALAVKYAAPEYAFLTEVRNQTGFGRAVRSADALAMSLWPSRGIYMTGFEVKISRADWMKELKDPSKAEEIARFCRLWFVATPVGIVKPHELPADWGLIELTEKGSLLYKKAAAERPPQEPTWQFFAALMRDVTESWTPTPLIEKRIRAREEEIHKSAELTKGFREKNLEDALRTANAKIAEFEKASGIKLDRYSDYFNREIGEAVKVLRSMGGTSPLDRLVQARAGNWSL